LVEGKPIGIGNVAYILGMCSKKLHRWYKEVLSGFKQLEEKGELDKNNISVKEKGEIKEIKVPILEEKNLGRQMAIDEKSINGDVYTILSNRESGKIALMASTIKAKYLTEILTNFSLEKRMSVESISRDMAPHYDWVARQVFMNAYHIVDKFHVIKNIIEQLQATRVHYRQMELTKRREAKNGEYDYIELALENGDTILQLLARSRGLLFLMPNEWNEQQKQRAKILFEKYPHIKKVYQAVIKIRSWYRPPKGSKTYVKTRVRKKEQISNIIKELKKSTINEIKNIAFLISKNIANILHYFIEKETNAKAEAINQVLQRFIITNYGARNMKFFLFRVKIYFT